MKTPLAIFALSLAAALAAVNAQAQQVDLFQEAGVSTTMADSTMGMSGYCGSCGDCGGCGDSCGGCGSGCGCCCPETPFAHRSGIFGEYLLLRPRDQEVAIAVPSQVPVVVGGLPTPVPQGRTVILDPDYQPGYRVGAAFAIECDLSAFISYTSFESSTSNGRTATADELQNNINIFPLLAHPIPLTPVAATNVATVGTMSSDFDIIDAGARSMLFYSNNFAINAFGGARWAHLEQDVRALYTINGGTVVLGNAEYDGIGGLGGIDFDYRTESGFGAYGKSSLALLYGAGRGSYLDIDAAGPNAFTDGKFDRLAPIWDMEMGVQWVSPQQGLRLALGYLTNVWFNQVTVRDYMVGVTHNQFDDFSDTITFDGVTARAEVRW
jgi:hypothetical protein